MDTLKNSIKSLINDSEGTWGIMIKDPLTKEQWTLNEHHQFYAASVIKLPIMAAVFKKIAKGHCTLEDEIVLQAESIVGGAGILQHMTLGKTYTIKYLITLMIIQSDNTATNILIDIAGKERIQNLLKRSNMKNSSFHHKLMIKDRNSDGSNMITAFDVHQFLEQLFDRKLISKEASNLMIDIMKKQQISNCLPKKLPYQELNNDDTAPYWELAHKTGWIPGCRHDAGIFFVNNYPMIVTVLSEKVDDLQSEAIIANIGKRVYKYLIKKTEG